MDGTTDEVKKSIVSIFNLNNWIIAVIIIFTFFLITKIIKSVLSTLAERYPERRIFLKNIIPVINIVLNIVTLLFLMFKILGFNMESFIAFGISAGVAIGFAIQDILSNSFAGLIILFTRPFNIGDKIEVSGHYGEVIDISILKIRIVTLDDSIVTIPSKNFLSSTVSNANGGELNCQVVTDIRFPSGTDISGLKETAYNAVYTSPYSYLKKPVVVLFADEYNYNHIMIMRIKSYVFDHRYEKRYSSDLYERVMLSFSNKSIAKTNENV